MPNPYSVGDEISTDELDQSLPIIMTAGETINGATLPVAVYIDDTTNEVFACDGNDQDKLEFIGLAISNSTDGNDITVQTKGVVSGFTGLDAGKKYYVQDNKTLGTSAGTYEVIAGIAISATQLLIMESPGMQYCGSAGDSSDTITVPTIARHAIVSIAASSAGGQSLNADLFISRKGKTSGSVSYAEAALGVGSLSASASWSDATITLSYGGTGNAVSGTAYFYR